MMPGRGRKVRACESKGNPFTIKRLYRAESADDAPDDIIVTYEQLSDGEQMLLGRMGMLFLLRGQDGLSTPPR